ncbi:6-O-methylguanine DNA methyltransferase [Collybia nuda]|uniref:Methylated-DNA--protein-cysteine methyltransferase n=1 Tax=Collybia nuda TaxID=64659 RepID=A0A9P6CFT3_9AGAR|nr:6-O-methylguanine DNA methyltransferase [Collybia nuda]
MPAIRLDKTRFSYNPATKKARVACISGSTVADKPDTPIRTTVTTQDPIPSNDIYFPIDASERKAFRTRSGKGLTSHQWDVYDYTISIPCGKVTTYKDVSAAVGGSPRSVGNALRTNPFAPYVPCHRVIASSFFIGGFFGEWGKDHKTGTRCNQKLGILLSEGVNFDKKGHLVDPDDFVWRGQ